MSTESQAAFNDLALSKPILKILGDVGYERPSPIQAETIPLILAGHDVVGQAQTGTGKTAAFALPILSMIDLKQKDPQVMVLAPTRELAIQVAEAFQKYATYLKGFHVLPIYGGQDYRGQVRALNRGVHVVVGTPGRVMDLMRKGVLKLNKLKNLVLDEADEMLRMGFIDDVEWILEQIPEQRQVALFSATMPEQIRRISRKYLNQPKEVTIKVKTQTADTIRQRFWPVSGLHKLDALTRILEAEDFEAMIVFVRTRTSTVELAEKLQARGFAAAPLNGDIPQNQRERTVARLKKGSLDILIATDVAARGLDVERISHVINYDIPYDTEAYVHRIGRTGRAGRKGDAILFVAPREKRMLFAIEKATRQKIDIMELPTTELINDARIDRFKQRITDTLAEDDMGLFAQLVEQYEQEQNVPAIEIAAAIAKLLQGDVPFLLQDKPQRRRTENWDRPEKGGHGQERSSRPRRQDRGLSADMLRYRLEVGYKDQVKPGNIVGAIANEAGIDSANIGRINIRENFTLVDLPNDMPKAIIEKLKKAWVAGQQLNLSIDKGGPSESEDKSTDDRGPGKSGKFSGKQKKRQKSQKPHKPRARNKKPSKKERKRKRANKG